MNREPDAEALAELVSAGRVEPPPAHLARPPGGDVPPVAVPGSEVEAAELLRRATSRGWRVRIVGRGSRAAAKDGEPPDLFLSAAGLAGVEAYEPADLTLRAGAGTTLAALDGETRPRGQWVALDPPGAPDRTLGAAVASGEHGPLHAGFGLPREQVLGVRLVTGDGRVVDLGGDVVKNVAGFDLLKPVVGSRGRLGLVTRATVRLHPVPPLDRTLLLPTASAREGAGLARRLAAVPVPVAAMELLAGVPELPPGAGGAAVAVRLLGRSETVDALEGRLLDAAGGGWFERLDGEASVELFRRLAREEGVGSGSVRIRCLPAELPATVAALEDGAFGTFSPDGAGLRAHVLSGCLRVAPGSGREDRSAPGPGESAARRSRSGESPVKERILAGIRRSFDPQGVLQAGAGAAPGTDDGAGAGLGSGAEPGLAGEDPGGDG